MTDSIAQAAEARSSVLQKLLDSPTGGAHRADRIRHIDFTPVRSGQQQPWPTWVPESVRETFAAQGIQQPWMHQVSAMELLWKGKNVVLATGTASGKSLAYLAPALSSILGATRIGQEKKLARSTKILYLAPTKSLAADQLKRVHDLQLSGVRAVSYDGDTPQDDRQWARQHANFLLSNPDLLHHALLPGHARWAAFLRGLEFIVIDECHHYRGVFGAQVAAVLRRLRRVAQHYGSTPAFFLASATISDPAEHAQRLLGTPVSAISVDTSQCAPRTIALWEPPLKPGSRGRRSTVTETAEVASDLVRLGTKTVIFVQSRRAVEQLTHLIQQRLEPDQAHRIAGYRGGYLAEDRRKIEAGLRSGDLLALVSTSALELGIDISGLDAVVLAGWPGHLSAFWQRLGRAGRSGQPALGIFIAADDPLDSFLMNNPQAIFGKPLETMVFDPYNPHILGPHLAAAAAELPLTVEDLPIFGPRSEDLLNVLVEHGILRRRASGWYWARRDRVGDHLSLRGGLSELVYIVEASTGRLLGTVDEAAADSSVHLGSVYLHQGQRLRVQERSTNPGVALVHPENSDIATYAKTETEVTLHKPEQSRNWSAIEVTFGAANVRKTVVSFRSVHQPSGQNLGETELDCAPRELATKAVWLTLPAPELASLDVDSSRLAGALHAAEHAAIALLPLFATCDRWDLGGISTLWHPNTGMPTIVVYDGQPGGAGFAEHGYRVLPQWFRATRDLIAACPCTQGCPACVQSPKCGNGNSPLDKSGALVILAWIVQDHN